MTKISKKITVESLVVKFLVRIKTKLINIVLYFLYLIYKNRVLGLFIPLLQVYLIELYGVSKFVDAKKTAMF